eukprot:jgi/Mesen1/8291/ME000045S07743
MVSACTIHTRYLAPLIGASAFGSGNRIALSKFTTCARIKCVSLELINKRSTSQVSRKGSSVYKGRRPINHRLMGSASGAQNELLTQGRDEEVKTTTDAFELENESAFSEVIKKDGLISIAGFGSLLSEKSARYTFPELVNFRLGRLSGFRRVFAHLAPIFFERGIANVETKEMSSLSVEPCEGESIIVSAFEIAASEVTLQPLDDAHPMGSRAVICARYSDEEYRQVRLKGDKEEYHRQYGRWGIEKIWTDDVLPCRTYLRHCVLASQRLGQEAHDSFLDHTFLADRKTSIRQHLAANPDIMEELPPPQLAERYGG